MPDLNPITYANPQTRTAHDRDADAHLRDAARELEATFLAEMLKSARVGEPREAFGGAVGEEQFASFLRLEMAQEMVRAGGVGLAEHIFQALKDRHDANAN
jgi:Rod binding domain-containing protein